MTIKENVVNILIKYPATRSNDLMLFYYYFKKYNKTTDIKDIYEMYDSNIFETIRRARQNIQKSNPLLDATPSVQVARRKREKKIREHYRKSI